MMRLCALCMTIGLPCIVVSADAGADDTDAQRSAAAAHEAAEAAFQQLLADAAATFATSHWVCMRVFLLCALCLELARVSACAGVRTCVSRCECAKMCESV